MAGMARTALAPGAARLLLALLMCGAPLAQAQGGGGSSLPAAAPVGGERLSDWLLRQAPQEPAYPLGLVWRVPAEQPAQARLKQELLDELARAPAVPQDARARLLAWVQALPVTGRVRLPVVDARWLQGNPRHDPVLRPDHALTLPQRPLTVTLVTPEGLRCTRLHQPGAQARDYLWACNPEHAAQVDRAWVVQPDGRIADHGVARWNEQTHDEPAPGALIWAPSRQSAWAVQLGPSLARFLATQGYEAAVSVLTAAPPAAAGVFRPGVAQDAQVTANDWGLIGLLQTPTARMAPAGEARFHYSRVHPYVRGTVLLQPFDALEVGFRYTTVLNRAYGPEWFSGDQTLKDKSFDFKLRLVEEGARVPQVALGMIDAAGTGLFSSEYLVASKRWGRFDWSLGMAWGYLGSSGNIGNPLAALDSRFKVRGGGIATGGTANTGAYFRGPTALFGGVQYTLPDTRWVLKAEVDGNDYRSEPDGNLQRRRAPLNLGLVYRAANSVDLSLGLERGSAVMLGMTLHAPLARLGAPKVSDPPTPAVVVPRPTVEPEWIGVAIDVSSVSGWGVRSIRREADTLQVSIDNTSGAHWDERIERIAAVLHRHAPASVEHFELVFLHQGVEMARRQISRQAWVANRTQFQPPAERQADVVPTPPQARAADAAPSLWERPPSKFGYNIVPSWQQNLGGPDGFLLFRAGVAVPAQWTISETLLVNGSVSLNLVDNFGRFNYTGPSQMPRVRTYLREYMTDSRLNLTNLQITRFGDLSTHQFYSLYAGYLESMYAGVGGEWLYRPWHRPLALGVDVNWVRQRSFDQFFGFGRAGTQTGYRVVTGHATAYWDTGWHDTQVKLSVGRYLAGDVGATLDLSRTFGNGVSMGAWATKTNVSAERFGEGSFDKGLYLRIPFDVMTTTRSGNVANLVYSPLTRDGGARLNRSFTLYGATTARSRAETARTPAPAGIMGSRLP